MNPTGLHALHYKSQAAQETRAVRGARKPSQIKLHDIEMSLRGTLCGVGQKFPFH
jgi:hypothetical protein